MDPVKMGAGQYLMLQGSDARVSPILEKAMAQGYTFSVAGTTLMPAREGIIAEGSTLADGGTFGSLCVLVVPDDVAFRCVVYGGYLAFTYHTARGIVRAGLSTARHAL